MAIIDKDEKIRCSFEYNPFLLKDYEPNPGLAIKTYPTILLVIREDYGYEFTNLFLRIFMAILYYKMKIWSKKNVLGRFVRVSNVEELLSELEEIPNENRLYVGKEGKPLMCKDKKGLHFYGYLKAIDEVPWGYGNKSLTTFYTIGDLIDILRRLPNDTKVYTSRSDDMYICEKKDSDKCYIDDRPNILFDDEESED